MVFDGKSNGLTAFDPFNPGHHGDPMTSSSEPHISSSDNCWNDQGNLVKMTNWTGLDQLGDDKFQSRGLS